MSLTSSKLSVTLLAGGDEKTPVHFKNENIKKELRILKFDDKKKVKLNEDSGSCNVNAQYSSYFRCDGAGDDLPARNTFRIIRGDDDYFLKVKEKLTYS